MTREEAISHGMEVNETVHSMKRRSPWHDYYRKGTYMLTLVVEGRKPLLGKLVNPPASLARSQAILVTPPASPQASPEGAVPPAKGLPFPPPRFPAVPLPGGRKGKNRKERLKKKQQL